MMLGNQYSQQPVWIYQLKIVLRGISPIIWRRLLVHSDTTIAALHSILQTAMGWEDSHLHRFRIHGKDYGIAYVGGISFADNPHQVELHQFRLQPGERFLYEYDFGDLWQHDVRLEAILPMDSNQFYPVCIAGKHACPPEDCGGPQRYLAEGQERTSLAALEDLQMLAAAMEQLLEGEGLGEFEDPDKRAELAIALERVREHERFNPALFKRRSVNAQLRRLTQLTEENHAIQNPIDDRQ